MLFSSQEDIRIENNCCKIYLSHHIIDSFPFVIIIRLTPVLLAPRGRKPRLTKLVLILGFLLSVNRCYIHNFSVWLRTCSNFNGNSSVSKPWWKNTYIRSSNTTLQKVPSVNKSWPRKGQETGDRGNRTLWEFTVNIIHTLLNYFS